MFFGPEAERALIPPLKGEGGERTEPGGVTCGVTTPPHPPPLNAGSPAFSNYIAQVA
jgi:hypothetical protein